MSDTSPMPDDATIPIHHVCPTCDGKSYLFGGTPQERRCPECEGGFVTRQVGKKQVLAWLGIEEGKE